MKRSIVVLSLFAFVCGTSLWYVTRSAAGGRTRDGAADRYARLASAPPAPSSLRSNTLVQAMARRGGIDPTTLVEVEPGNQPLGAILGGRNQRGQFCLAEARQDMAGSFHCAPFAEGPLHLAAGARGTPSGVAWAGFVAVADSSVTRAAVRTADGSIQKIAINAAGGLAYGGWTPAAFPVELTAYAADGRVVLEAPLPEPTTLTR